MSKLKEVIKMLKEVVALDTFIDIRRRYSDMERWKIEGPELKSKQQYLWLEAKQFICEHRDELDKLACTYEGGSELDNYTQAVLVIEKEAQQMVESLMTGDTDES